MGFITAGVLVYGTGYYYPPVVVPGRVPAYLPYPYSYAGSVYYNPANGAWARGGTVYGPYGGAATGGTYYNPTTGGLGAGGAVYGPYGGAGAWSAYNPRTGTYAHGSAAWGPNGGTAHATSPTRATASPAARPRTPTLMGAGDPARLAARTRRCIPRAPAMRRARRARSVDTGAEAAGVQRRGGNNAAVATRLGRQRLRRRRRQRLQAHRQRLVEMGQWLLEPGAEARHPPPTGRPPRRRTQSRRAIRATRSGSSGPRLRRIWPGSVRRRRSRQWRRRLPLRRRERRFR